MPANTASARHSRKLVFALSEDMSVASPRTGTLQGALISPPHHFPFLLCYKVIEVPEWTTGIITFLPERKVSNIGRIEILTVSVQ